ncbi:MAG: hypothetical protein GXY42_01915 [Desulfovibrionales bacterium]|nr:hypothetical protein [Desulfovibrionales bacterium]
MSAIPILRRITTEYVDIEDRIRLCGESGPGQSMALWLSRRLLNRLVPHVCQWLEKDTPSTDHGSTSSSRLEALQGFAQQAAVAAMPALPPVHASAAGTTSWLVHSIDASKARGGIILTFKGPEAEEGRPMARLALSDELLRQWLNILHGQYRKGQWSMEVWPQWIGKGTTQTMDSPPQLLH